MSTEIINTIDYNYPLDRYERDALYGAYLVELDVLDTNYYAERDALYGAYDAERDALYGAYLAKCQRSTLR